MDRRSLEVQGKLAEKLPESLYNQMNQNGGKHVERYTGDGFDVIVAEEYQFRTNSDLQATIVIEQEAAERVSVTMIAGGGGHGLLRWDWGTESNHTDSLVSTLKRVCDQWGLSLGSE